MRKPETTFIASVHRLLPKNLHAEKMNNPYRSGTADVWYSGNKADMWVEYKFLPTLPVKKDEIIADLSPLQIKWLRERHNEGRSIFVIIGCPLGGVVLSNLEWEQPIPISAFKTHTLTRSAIAEWLVNETLGNPNEPVKEDLRGTGIQVKEERANVTPGTSTLSKIGSATHNLILRELKKDTQPPKKYAEHLKLLWARGEVKFDGQAFYL